MAIVQISFLHPLVCMMGSENSRAADHVHAPPSCSNAMPTTSRRTPSASGIAPIHIGGASTISSPPRTTRTSATVRRADRLLIIVGFPFQSLQSGFQIYALARDRIAPSASQARHSTRITQSVLIVIKVAAMMRYARAPGGASPSSEPRPSSSVDKRRACHRGVAPRALLDRGPRGRARPRAMRRRRRRRG